MESFIISLEPEFEWKIGKVVEENAENLDSGQKGENLLFSTMQWKIPEYYFAFRKFLKFYLVLFLYSCKTCT